MRYTNASDVDMTTATEPKVLAIYYNIFKRSIDILGSIVGIIIFSPIMIVVAIAIMLDSEGPVLADIPKRVGKNGKLFRMYKFRSMYKGSHQLLHQNPKLLEEYKKNSYKLKNDPRITSVGKVIRKLSIDEFPQFFNILEGDMSLVGPRAYNPDELEEQPKRYPDTEKFVKIILQAKPGLTGLWQISGRSEINFDKRVQIDAQYVLRRSIIYDIWIIVNTIPAVLMSRGAG